MFSKKIGFSLAKVNKVADSVAPSVVLFGKHLFAASSLVLIFSKKAGFSLTKVNKVAVPRPLSFLENISSQHHLWC
jgi:hypothetical protein